MKRESEKILKKKCVFFSVEMDISIPSWLHNSRVYIKKNYCYHTGEFNEYYNFSGVDINNIDSDETLNKIIDIMIRWDCYKQYPIEIYISILNGKTPYHRIMHPISNHLADFYVLGSYRKHKYADHTALIGNLELFIYLQDNNYPIHNSVISCAITGNNIDLLSYILNNGFTPSSDNITSAAWLGNMKALKILFNQKIDYKNCYEITKSIIRIMFIKNKNEIVHYFDILKFCIDKGCPIHIENYWIHSETNLPQTVKEYLITLK